MAKILPNDGNCKPTDSESSIKPSTRNMKKITSEHIVMKLFKTSDEEKSLKTTREEKKKSHICTDEQR